MATVNSDTGPAPLPTSLDPRETNVELGWERAHPFPFVHRRHEQERFKLIRMFATSSSQRIRHRAWKLRDCCANPTIRRRVDGSTYFSPSRCRDRLCPLCARIVARQTSERVLKTISSWDQARHLVLTLKSTDEPLVEQIDHLMRSFRRLRQRRWWKERVSGGIGTLEITFNESTKQWHPHLHVILNGEYLPHSDLKAQWQMVTNDSTIVHITAVHSRDDASRYIAKYVSKPSDVAKLDQSPAVELAIALTGRRTVIAFGTAHGVGLPARQKGTDQAGSSHVVTVSAIRKALHADQAFAKWAVHRLHQENSPVALWVDPEEKMKESSGSDSYLLASSTLDDLLMDCKQWAMTGNQPVRLTPTSLRNKPQPWLWSNHYP